MDEATKSKLDAIFAKDAALKLDVQNKRDLEAEAQARFLAQYVSYREATLLPALEEFGDYVRAKGWTVKVTHGEDQPSSVDGQGRMREQGQQASGRIEYIRPGDENIGAAQGHAFVQFKCEKSTRTVGTHQSTISPGRGGSTGGGKSYSIENLNHAAIHVVLAEHFSQLFR